MSLKKIAAKVSDIFIAEDENYKLALARNYGDGPEKMFLFEVAHNFTGEKNIFWLNPPKSLVATLQKSTATVNILRPK